MGSVGRHAPVVRARFVLALCALFTGLGAPAGALVHMAGDGSGNLTPPPDDPGFANVGTMANGLGGIYVGSGWVLTASHVGGEQSITLAGVTYPPVPGTHVVLQHAPGVRADLAMERISGSPPLAPLLIAAVPPAVGETVTMIGRGWARAATQTCWNAGWSEIPCSPGPVFYHGFKQTYSAPPGARWGRNQVVENGFEVVLPGSTTRAFEVSFDSPGLAEETQAVNGDSGGAVFVKRSSQWQLVGVMFTISLYLGQPSSTAMFGNRTYSVDLTHYRSQILSIMGTPAVPALPWPAVPLVAGALAGIGRTALSARRRDRTRARRG